MIALLQRVRHASLTVDGQILAAIQAGILVFAAIEKSDTQQSCQRMAQRILSWRLFSSPGSQKMERSVVDTDGEVLLVPQFTLAANTCKGTRASFSSACPPAQAESLFADFVTDCQAMHKKTLSGRFAADMQVQLLNDGPVTFILRTSS